MEIKDFCDMKQFESILQNWSIVTGLACVAVNQNGDYISECYNFTEFCIDLTRKSREGRRRCEKCDREGKGVYTCHAGLIDFAMAITLEDGTVLGNIVGGQVLPENPDEEKFRMTAKELQINESNYIDALHKVNIRKREKIEASAKLLGAITNLFVRQSYAEKENQELVSELKDGIQIAAEQLKFANENTKQIKGFASKQRMLALNASIEAARAGEFGRGFSVVAKEVQKLATGMNDASKTITKTIEEVTDTIQSINNH